MAERVKLVNAGDKMGGGILTQEGADAVNATRIRVARGQKEPLGTRLIRAAGMTLRYDKDHDEIVEAIRKSEKEIYPDLKI